MTEKEVRKLSRSGLRDLVKMQDSEIEHLSELLEESKRKLESPLIERPLPGSLTEMQAEVQECFHRAQETADQYLRAVRAVCDSAESVRTGP